MHNVIYDGIWVGEGSSIPNIRGIRKDVVDALKPLKFLCFAGREAAFPINTIGVTASGHAINDVFEEKELTLERKGVALGLELPACSIALIEIIPN